MAPEVFARNYTEKCDIWACGVILYIILSGIPPFNAKNLELLKKTIIKGKYSYSNKVWDNVSISAKDLIDFLLTKDPYERPSALKALEH